MGHPETERDWDAPQQHAENESGNGVLIERRVREGCDRHEFNQHAHESNRKAEHRQLEPALGRGWC